MLVLTAFAAGTVGAASAGNTADDGSLSGGVTQAEDGSVTVTVEQNGTGVDGADVTVDAVDNGSYAGEGEYTTENGTVGLPAPEQNVTVTFTVTYGNETASTTEDLAAATTENETENETDAFGLEVSAFVHGVLASNDTSNATVGQMVSEYVTANNPGAEHRPDWAGPDGDKRQGPPDDKGPDGDKRQGPPDDKGPDRDGEDTDTDDEDGDDDSDDSGGPPAHAGNGK